MTINIYITLLKMLAYCVLFKLTVGWGYPSMVEGGKCLSSVYKDLVSVLITDKKESSFFSCLSINTVLRR